MRRPGLEDAVAFVWDMADKLVRSPHRHPSHRQPSHHDEPRTCGLVTLASDTNPRLAQRGVHVSPSRLDQFDDLFEALADDSAATGFRCSWAAA
jgi:hypothetical protein